MTDQQIPDQISWTDSGIIIKQLVMVIISVGSLAGMIFSPDEVAKITAVVTAVTMLVLSLWTVHNRLSKPCPPILPVKDNK